MCEKWKERKNWTSAATEKEKKRVRIRLSEFTYSSRSSLRIRFWFSSWTWWLLLNLTFWCCLLVMTSLAEHFCRSLAVDACIGSLARFVPPLGLSSIRIRPLCVTIQLDFGRCSQLWLLHVDMRLGVRFGCDRNAFGLLHDDDGDEVFLHVSTMLVLPLKSRDKHSSIAVIHFEAVRLSSQRCILNHMIWRRTWNRFVIGNSSWIELIAKWWWWCFWLTNVLNVWRFVAMVKRGSSEGRRTVLFGMRQMTSLNDTNFFSYSSRELYDISRPFWSTK